MARKRAYGGTRTNAKKARTSSGNVAVTADVGDDISLQLGGERTLKKQLAFTRKERRKEERKLKKARKDAFIRKQKLPTIEGQLAAKQRAYDDKVRRAEVLKLRREKKLEKRRLLEQLEREEEMKQKAFLDARKEDEREIKKMEKLLHLNKRKNKSTLPQIFAAEGLDYILDAIDSKKLQSNIDLGNSDADELDDDKKTESDNDSDSSDAESDKEPRDSGEEIAGEDNEGNMTEDEAAIEEDEESKGDDSVEEGDGDDGSGADEVETNGDESSNDEHSDGSVSSGKGAANGEPSETYHEDIYGRLRDAQGNVVRPEAATSQAYVPPAKRLEAEVAVSSQKRLELMRLNKQLKGLVNRLSEGNMQTVCTQIEALYGHHSRADVNAGLASLVADACLGKARAPERLSIEMAMMVALLHNNVGNEVGAIFVEMLAKRFNELHCQRDYGDSKEVDNIVAFLCSLYNFQVIHGGLLLDVIDCLVEHFSEKDIEVILVALKGCGFSLRKDEPEALKSTLKAINVKAGSVDISQFEDRSRVGFMLEVLTAIKNNNMRKIPNYDQSHTEHLKKLLRSFSKNASLSEGQLRISLADLLVAGSKGKWWVVGSAWHGNESGTAETAAHTGKNLMAVTTTANEHILELARKQRMNTDVRRSVFCIVMTSEDFIDAYEKLLKLGLKNQPEREIIHVIIDCCMQEKKYNAFYSHLVQKFLELDRRFQMTFQFNLWDKFKVMDSTANFSVLNLAAMVVHLLSVHALSLSALKAIEFGAMDKGTLRFTKAVLTGLLAKDDSVVKETFSRIAAFPKLRLLREGLKIFMRHFLIGKRSMEGAGGSIDMAEKVALAEMAIASPEDATHF